VFPSNGPALKDRIITLSDLAMEIAKRNAESNEESVSKYVERVLLSQDLSTPEVEALLRGRPGPGRPRVHVLPDDAVLPPEG